MSYEINTYMYYFFENMGQGISFSLTFADCPAFYQSSSFYKSWVKAAPVNIGIGLSS
jgi:hypothetical protein